LAYGEYGVKTSSSSERQRRFKEGREDVQEGSRSGQPETQRTDANGDRARTLLSDGRLGVRLIAEELNMGIWKEETTRTLTDKWILHHDKAPDQDVLRFP
jgi:hypothetical protein